MTNLPESIQHKHFNLNVKDPIQDGIFEYCTQGLMIPGHHLVQFEKVTNMDSYWVYTANGCRFMVSGPELMYYQTDGGVID